VNDQKRYHCHKKEGNEFLKGAAGHEGDHGLSPWPVNRNHENF
jgi:hypothetical protein